MRINIVSPYQSIAMQYMTRPLKELSRLYDITESKDVDTAADLNIHCPFHTLVDDRDYGGGKHIAVYTHCNPGAEGALINACARADIVTAMSFAGRQELLNFGVDPKKIWVIYSAADMFQYRKRAVVVVGYPQPNGRKRESLLLDLAWQYDLTPFQFFLVGEQWDDLASKLLSLGVEVQHTNANTPELIKKLYQMSDIFLATGYMEGGPLPLLEAMASGIPVYSPRFGYAADLLDEQNIYDTPADLMDKLSAEVKQSIRYHQTVRSWSWQDYAAEYALLIGRLFNATVDLYPERGASRYVQLLDIIADMKPRQICEVGTWNGNRAIQMLQEAGKYHPMKRLSYQGFDLFDTQTGEQFIRELSKAGFPVDVVHTRIKATGANVELITGETFDTIKRVNSGRQFIFLDGGHSEDTIQNDAEVLMESVKMNDSVIVFDDYYHGAKPAGVGCNKFIDALDPLYYEITHLPARTHASDGREIGMVKICRNMSTVTRTDTLKKYH